MRWCRDAVPPDLRGMVRTSPPASVAISIAWVSHPLATIAATSARAQGAGVARKIKAC